MTETEWETMLKSASMWDRADKYIDGSYIMTIDYDAQKSYTEESEAHFLSKGQVNPMQYRFK